MNITRNHSIHRVSSLDASGSIGMVNEAIETSSKNVKIPNVSEVERNSNNKPELSNLNVHPLHMMHAADLEKEKQELLFTLDNLSDKKVSELKMLMKNEGLVFSKLRKLQMIDRIRKYMIDKHMYSINLTINKPTVYPMHTLKRYHETSQHKENQLEGLLLLLLLLQPLLLGMIRASYWTSRSTRRKLR